MCKKSESFAGPFFPLCPTTSPSSYRFPFPSFLPPFPFFSQQPKLRAASPLQRGWSASPRSRPSLNVCRRYFLSLFPSTSFPSGNRPCDLPNRSRVSPKPQSLTDSRVRRIFSFPSSIASALQVQTVDRLAAQNPSFLSFLHRVDKVSRSSETLLPSFLLFHHHKT